ncbi:tail fiber domain-containing protein [Candidatus Liberibacter americanus]|uniref:Peptidase S74 domain-containing protein n=1 Tax=Candidatus Liberibacter americanus str. Sao Paulo TaxID=1261131 RepID=U6B7M0_9HYPH|nr:tail fiber domain-containing protein [Candidatus Liberibacter americanus]AHA27861.1 hypothetical protein lam_502 [Candidatus Liberibacter americanus str. Sao Paulo]EMS35904.1 hypothetical protein G653_04251 [Candidatus Liberibacter americanus PW_SP]
MPRIKDVYVLPSGTKAYPNSSISSSSYNNLLEDLAFDNNYPRPISAGGTDATNIDQARINLGADDASNLKKGFISEKLLPFQPVQQGGGIHQANNKIYLGWNGRNLLLQVDSLQLEDVWTSKLAPIALQNLVNHANTADRIVYTSSDKKYLSSPLSSFMRKLLDCKDHEKLQMDIFKDGIKIYKDSIVIFELTNTGDIICDKRSKTVWQGIDSAKSIADDMTKTWKDAWISNTNIINIMRAPGYIHFDTDKGPVGCAYFSSDERLKQVHGYSTDSALDIFDKLEFIDFNYLPSSCMDSSSRHPIGFSANNLQKANPLFVDQIGDYLSPNISVIVTYLAKSVQELSQQVQELSQQVQELRSLINKKSDFP